MAPLSERSACDHGSKARVAKASHSMGDLELLHAPEGVLSRWSQLNLQSFVPTPVLRRVNVRQAAVRKNNCQIFITT
jgi:hypothetical protein